MKERILIVQNVQKNVQECKIALDSLINVLLSYNNFTFEQYPELGLQQIDQLVKGLFQMKSIEEDLFKQFKQAIEQIKSIIDEIIKKIKPQTNIKQNYTIQISQKPNLNPFIFDLINQNSIKQNEWCRAIAFNKDNSIVIAGCDKDIKVFQHTQGKLNQIQSLSEHKYQVQTLNFMQYTNNFVSGSGDNSIIIWKVIGINQWQCQQILNGHSNAIFCLLLNNTDNLIISGSEDTTIKFWMKSDQWLCQQTITDHTHYLYSLSLNEQQNKLISCSYDSQILVIEKQHLARIWCVTQKIKVDYYGYRLCFINDDQFTFQPRCKEQMVVYELDSNTKEYKKTKEIAVKCGSSVEPRLFPQQYLASKCLLVNKNGKNVNFMRRKENGDFLIIQSIEFGHCDIYGQLSDDGEYLITWDYESKEIQIRKCREL
ncbi:unnamed protein product [Paramecium sonneborni]|uniref:Uncharacterized protein n=1 Tax=Paramecium sonneborni TaxID=65129 RepID=A0A8S1RQ93_9CILI|nr:unnamed protein product [Paramecium sonneborni]